jgi:hypothetical protein
LSLFAAAAGDEASAAVAAAPQQARTGRGRVAHVDQLWEEQPGSSSTLQVRQAAAAAAALATCLSTSVFFR